MSARGTGTGNAITTDFSGLGGFDDHPVAELRAAQDARLLLGDGTTQVTRSGNNISDLLPGVTINLMYADAGTPVTVNVDRDNESLMAGVKSMVEALNGAVNAVKRNVAYDATTKAAATLNGDPRAQIVTDRLRSAIQSTVEGSDLSRLAQLGIAVTADGVYRLDERKLREAIEGDREAVARLLIGEGLAAGSGVMTKVVNAVKDLTTGVGPVASAVTGARESAARLDQDLIDEDRRLALVEERIRRKYTALESTLATLSSQANGLTAALAG
jgi:flagellar hook-associated protein 2